MKLLDNIKVLQLPKIIDERGNLTFVEGEKHIPFAIKRTYMIYDVPGGEVRGGHAYKKLNELIIALSGSFDLFVDDGCNQKVYTLNRSYYAVWVPEGIWRRLENFSTNSLCLVLASTQFDETDYIRDYQTFLKYNNGK